MGQFFKIILIVAFVLMSFFNTSAFAYQLSENELRGIILKEVKHEAQKYTDGEVEVAITGLLYTPVKTNGNVAPKVSVTSNQQKFMHRDIKRVLITENGVKLASFPVNVSVNLYKDVVVAKDIIKQFDIITSENTEYKRMEVGLYHDKVLTQINTQKAAVAMRNFAPGALILTNYTRSKPDITRNAGVNILFESVEGLQIEMEGTAMGEGNVGDLVLVKSSKYNKVHSGQVIGQNTVRIRI